MKIRMTDSGRRNLDANFFEPWRCQIDILDQNWFVNIGKDNRAHTRSFVSVALATPRSNLSARGRSDGPVTESKAVARTNARHSDPDRTKPLRSGKHQYISLEGIISATDRSCVAKMPCGAIEPTRSKVPFR